MNISTNLNLEIVRKLNDEGKNSVVYIMHDTQLDTNLVVKCIAKSNFLNPDDYFTEAATIYSVEHPNIVKIQHATDDDDYIYLSMPYYRNGSMQSLMNDRFLTVKEIVEFSLGFLTGLHYIHTKQLIHFDIKPTNILIHDNGKALLTDFGLSKYTDSSGLSFPDLIYPIHIPPEMLKGSLLSNKADIYQAGMTLYRMCNGNDNYYKQFKQHNSEIKFSEAVACGKFPDRNLFLPHIPMKLRRIIKTALNINPDDRYNTVMDMINDISTIDKNLNIAYSQDTNTCSETWEYTSSNTHKFSITLKKHGNVWDILGKKIRLSDNNSIRINSLCINGYTNRNKGLKKIKEILNG